MAPRRRPPAKAAVARGASPGGEPTATPAPPSRPATIKTEGGGGGRSTRAGTGGGGAAPASTPASVPPAPGTPQTSPRPTGLATAHLVRRPPARAATTIDDLPDELLLKVRTGEKRESHG